MDNYLDRQIKRKIRLLTVLRDGRRKRQAVEAAEARTSPARMKNRTDRVIENITISDEQREEEDLAIGAQQPVSARKLPVPAGSG